MADPGSSPKYLSTPVPSSTPRSGVVAKGAKTILVVDPDAGVRGELAAALSSRFFVQEAADGATALQLAKTIRPSLVIAELAMPGLDGLALARMLKTQPAPLRHVPLVILSSRTAPHDIAKAVAAGARRYLIKPCLPETVADIATRIIER